MRLTRLLLAASVLTLAEPAIAAAPAPAEASPQTLTCTGDFSKDMTEASLKKAFGEKNVVYKDVGGPEGTEAYATVVHPDDPAKSVTVYWTDEKSRTKPAGITINAVFKEDDGTYGASSWSSEQGIIPGKTGIEEVQKINGKAFKVSGFDWDYGGNALGWDGGALDKAGAGGCSISLTFAPTGSVGDKAEGDTEIASDDPDVLKGKPVVTSVTLSFADETAPK